MDKTGTAVETQTLADPGIGVRPRWRAVQCAGFERPERRSGAASVVYRDCLYLFGGYGGHSRLDDLCKFDFVQQRWFKVRAANSPSARENNGAVVYRGCMYIFGGYSGIHWLQDLHAFDFKKEEWHEVETGGEKPSARFGFVSALCATDGVLYLYGGYDGTSWLRDMHELNLHTSQWTETKQQGHVPSGRSCPSWAYHQDCIYMFGGYDGVNRLSDFFCFHIPTRCWTLIAVHPPPGYTLTGSEPPASSPPCSLFPPSVRPQSSTGANTHSADAFLSSVVADNSTLQSWVSSVDCTPRRRRADVEGGAGPQTAGRGAGAVGSGSSLAGGAPSARYFHAAAAHRNCLYIFGGYNGHERLNDLYVFNLDTHRWQVVEGCDTPSGRSSMVAQVYRNSLYIFGGYNGHNVLNDFYEFKFEGVRIPGSTFLADLRRLLAPPDSDVTFVVEGGKRLYACKAILIARSEHFRALFNSGLKETEMAENGLPISIEDVQYEVMAALLEYLHIDMVCERLSCQQTVQLMIAAERFCVDRLKCLCVESLRRMLNVENVVEVLIAANTHNILDLKEICLDFLLEHEEDVKERDAMRPLISHAALLYEVYMRSSSGRSANRGYM